MRHSEIRASVEPGPVHCPTLKLGDRRVQICIPAFLRSKCVSSKTPNVRPTGKRYSVAPQSLRWSVLREMWRRSRT